MSKKTLIIILLVLLLVIVLFAVSLLLPARDPAARFKFDTEAPNLARIADLLSRPAKAENLTLLTDSIEGCGFENAQITVQPGVTCSFSVASDKVWTRKLRLALLPPQEGLYPSVFVTLEQPEALKVEQPLEMGKTFEPLDIYGRKDRAAATLRIRAPISLDTADAAYVIELIEK